MRSKFRLATCLSAGFVVLTMQFAVAQDKEIADAKRLVEVDQSTKALQALTTAATTYPTSAAVFYNLGVAQLKANLRKEALASFDKGIAADPKEALNYAGKAQLSIMEAAPEKAKLDIDKALSMTKSKNVAVLQAVARAYMADPKKANDAIAVLTTAKARDGQNAETMILLGDAYLQLNDGGKAVSAYESGAALDQKSALAHYKVGRVYLRSRNFDAAQESFAKAISIDPNYALAYKEQGELFYQQKKSKEAVAAYEKFMTLTESPEKYQSRIAFYYLQDKNFDKANGIFDQLMAKDSSTAYIYRYAGVTKFELQDYPSAEKTFEKYFTIVKPEAIEVGDYNYAGKIELAMKQDSLAMEYFKKSLEKDPKQPELYQLMAESYYGQRKFPESIDAYKKLFEVKKPASADYYTLGRAYYFNSQFVQADSTFATLSELQPTMTIGPFWQARSKAAQDSTSENGLAKPYYEKLVEKALTTPDKSKTELVESYMYLGYYSYLKGQTSAAKQFYSKVLAIDPANEKAKVAMKALTAPPPQPKAKPKTGG
ncbi:MAG: tetratricopeptide repeat protein [Chryseolinea sp.]